jgi:large subunit ribosomal protein L3
MKKFIIGKKLNMTQNFREDGTVVPVTAVFAPAIVVTQVKTKETDGYNAVQVGFAPTKESRVNKAQLGHVKGAGSLARFKEFRLADVSAFKVGDKIDVSIFAPGDAVTISGTSKGKGFQGVVKRHGFAGGRRTHGQKHSEREPGAIGGAGRSGGRVVKGMRMAGRMGGERITVSGLKIEAVVPEQNAILISGAVPGSRGSVVEIKAN